ncbi:MAG: hypothetical protein CVV39_08645 [Planctomycetes bacterium HGW-Planctomycetes-1]|nr:MAG: hypothetical protein CVV39_08645 [Planctomycetes bacterium HGW-Planctomycetes-1]
MGFKSKFLFLLIVYFAGFATAVYYLSPNGRAGPASAYENNGVMTALTDIGEKASSRISDGFANMDKEKFKAAYDRAAQAVRNMTKSRQNVNEPDNGGEDK